LTLHLACAARRDYVPHAATMLRSVLVQPSDLDVRVHFLHGPDLGPAILDPLRAMVERDGGEIEFLEIEPGRVEGLRTQSYLPASHWYRVFLPELLEGVDRVLYLDADLLALEPVDELWRLDLEDHPLAAVSNVLQENHAHRPAELGLPSGQAYFNSGVMLLNLAQMRDEGATSALLDFARTNAEVLAWPEQDALNVVLGDRRLALHPRWNLMNSLLIFPWASEVFEPGQLEEARARPAIRHFEGPSVNKPWHYLCERDMRDLYAEHRAHTPWPTFRPEGLTLRRRLARLVRP
jgi:lipopolysaccharide biosynthesis glycosyltransferase